MSSCYKTMHQKHKIIIFRKDGLTPYLDDGQLIQKLRVESEKEYISSGWGFFPPSDF